MGLSGRKQAYVDGVVTLANPSSTLAAIGADFSDASGYSKLHTMSYQRMSASQQDVELADADGYAISAKLRTPYAADVDPSLYAIVGSRVYELSKVDRDSSRLYLYLTELQTDGTLTLVSENVTYDDMRHRVVQRVEKVIHVRKCGQSTVRDVMDEQDVLQPASTLRIRACDYSDQQTCIRGGVTYSITGAVGAGKWLDVTCKRMNGGA